MDFLLFKRISDVFYAPICLVCGKGLVCGEKHICTRCAAGFPFYDDVREYFSAGDGVEFAYFLFFYNRYSDYKNIIHAIKYRERKDAAYDFGRMLGKKMSGDFSETVLMPVPLHPLRLKERGYNQALCIAEGMASVLKLPVVDNVILRIRNNRSQTGKNAEERKKNVSGIFAVEQKEVWRIEGKRILMVDDVFTTGATIFSCIETLRRICDFKFSVACLAVTDTL